MSGNSLYVMGVGKQLEETDFFSLFHFLEDWARIRGHRFWKDRQSSLHPVTGRYGKCSERTEEKSG